MNINASSPASGESALHKLLFNSQVYDRSLGRRPITTLATDTILSLGGNPEIADHLFQGNYSLAGYSFHIPALPPWEIDAPSCWHDSLQSFGWLDHFGSVNNIAAGKHARNLIKQWLQKYYRWDERAWRLPIIGRRLESWCTNSNFLLRDAEPKFVSSFASSIFRQTRHLQRWSALSNNRLDRIQIGIGLLLSAIILRRRKMFLQGFQLIEDEVQRYFQPDGTVLECNPSEMLESLRKLRVVLLVSDTNSDINKKIITPAAHQLGEALQALRHGDEKLAIFNGSFEEEKDKIDRILSLVPKKSNRTQPISSLPYGGFERLSARRLLIIAKSGTQQHSYASRIGPLSFELSVGRQRVVVNCGTFSGDNPEWKQAMLNNAAYSTLTINETNPALNSSKPGIEPALRGEEDDSTWVELRHNGYREKFGIVHVRRLHAHRDGHEIVGIDSLFSVNATLKPSLTNAVLRFHLHPAVKASQTGHGGEVLLRLDKGPGWLFETGSEPVKLEESIYMGKEGEMRRSNQIIIRLPIGGGKANITWHFTQLTGRE